MTPDRHHKDMLVAHAVGAVACPNCIGVHVDMIDSAGRVIATGFLTFDAWALLTAEVEDQINAMARGENPHA